MEENYKEISKEIKDKELKTVEEYFEKINRNWQAPGMQFSNMLEQPYFKDWEKFFEELKNDRKNVKAHIHSIGHYIRENLRKGKESEEVLNIYESGLENIKEGLELWEKFKKANHGSSESRAYGRQLMKNLDEAKEKLYEALEKTKEEIS